MLASFRDMCIPVTGSSSGELKHNATQFVGVSGFLQRRRSQKVSFRRFVVPQPCYQYRKSKVRFVSLPFPLILAIHPPSFSLPTLSQ